MARAERSGRKARLLPTTVGMVLLQEVMEIRLVGEAFLRPGNLGIQDQRARRGSASLVAFAAESMREYLSGNATLPGVNPADESLRA